MRGSVILWSLMASAPALLLGVLGIVGRTQVSTWEFETYTDQQTKDLLEYQAPVKASAVLRRMDMAGRQAEAITMKVADYWLRLEEEGKLKDVLPGSMGDQGSNGVKSQILEARQDVINLLTYLSYEKRHQGKPFESVMASAKALAIADIFKYSGSAALQQSGMAQASCVRAINHQWGELSESEKAEARLLMRRAYRPDNPVLLLAEQISHLSIQSKMRLGHSMADLSTVFQVSQISALAEPNKESRMMWGPTSAQYGLDTAFSNVMSAALRGEQKLQASLEELVILE